MAKKDSPFDPGNPDNAPVQDQENKPVQDQEQKPSQSAETKAEPKVAKVDMKMSPEDFAGLRAQVAAISQQDFHLGRFLTDLLGHLGHAHGLDAAQEDARLAAEARKKARADEDAALKTAADERAKARTAEDAQTRTSEQQAALTNARAAEDAQLKADAEALQKKRDDEDAATKAASNTGVEPVRGT